MLLASVSRLFQKKFGEEVINWQKWRYMGVINKNYSLNVPIG